MKKLLLISACYAFSASATPLSGGVAGKVSTLGLGIEYVAPITPQVEVGVGANYFNFNYDFAENDLDLKLNAKLLTLGAIGYYYPLDNGFNINGGLYYNGSNATLKALPKQEKTYTINNVKYSTNDIRDAGGELDFNKIAPYLGIGWKSGNRNAEGLTFSANLGVLFQGSANVKFDATCTGNLAKNKSLCNELHKNIDAEAADINKRAKDYQFYPVASIGFIYRF